MADIVAARDLGHRLTTLAASQRLALLMWGEFRSTAEPYAAGFRPCPPLASSRTDQFALELGEPAQDGQHQATMRGGGIRPGIAERTETGTFAGDCRERVQKIAGRARQTVE